MASLAIHHTIAQEYCKKHSNVDFSQFLRGSIEPDLAQDKGKSHFSKQPKNETFEEYAKAKVGIVDYVNSKELVTDFDYGEFMHLLTDYLFYYKYLINTKEFKESGINNLPQAIKVMFNEFDKVTGLLVEHYKIDLNLLPEQFRKISNEKMQIIKEKDIIKFINQCVDLDLAKEYKKIKEFDLQNQNLK